MTTPKKKYILKPAWETCAHVTFPRVFVICHPNNQVVSLDMSCTPTYLIPHMLRLYNMQNDAPPRNTQKLLANLKRPSK